MTVIYALVDPRTNASGKRSDAFRRRMAQVARETKNALGHMLDEETKERISKKLQDYYANGGETMKGERNGHSKLTEKDVIDLRKQYSQGGVSLRSLAKEYGMSHESIRKAITGVTWTHIGEN